MSDNLNDMLASPTRLEEEARDTLTKIWRRMLSSNGLNIEVNRLTRLMIQWLSNPTHGVANTNKSRSSERGNMDKALSADTMTWKVFEDAIRFIQPRKAMFTVDITMVDGTQWSYTFDILASPVRSAEGPCVTLANVWRDIMRDHGITPDSNYYKRLMHRWVTNPANGIPDTSNDRSSERGNRGKALASDTMTWKVFEDALRWLAPRAIRFTTAITDALQDTTTYTIDMTIRDSTDNLDYAKEPVDE